MDIMTHPSTKPGHLTLSLPSINVGAMTGTFSSMADTSLACTPSAGDEYAFYRVWLQDEAARDPEMAAALAQLQEQGLYSPVCGSPRVTPPPWEHQAQDHHQQQQQQQQATPAGSSNASGSSTGPLPHTSPSADHHASTGTGSLHHPSHLAEHHASSDSSSAGTLHPHSSHAADTQHHRGPGEPSLREQIARHLAASHVAHAAAAASAPPPTMPAAVSAAAAMLPAAATASWAGGPQGQQQQQQQPGGAPANRVRTAAGAKGGADGTTTGSSSAASSSSRVPKPDFSLMQLKALRKRFPIKAPTPKPQAALQGEYSVQDIIGRGAFGAAYLAHHLPTGRLVCIKAMDAPHCQADAQRREVAVLAALALHPNIIRYHECFAGQGADSGKLHLVMEYADGGDLASLIERHHKARTYMSEEQLLGYFVQLVAALAHVHAVGIMHRDIKANNIFLTRSGLLKLGDFGISKVLDCPVSKDGSRGISGAGAAGGSSGNSSSGASAASHSYMQGMLAHSFVGTPNYLAPEAVACEGYNMKADIWAAGCVLYEMAALKPAFRGKHITMIYHLIRRGKTSALPPVFSEGLQQLQRRMMDRDPNLRPSAYELLHDKLLRPHVERHKALLQSLKLELPRLPQPRDLSHGSTTGGSLLTAAAAAALACGSDRHVSRTSSNASLASFLSLALRRSRSAEDTVSVTPGTGWLQQHGRPSGSRRGSLDLPRTAAAAAAAAGAGTTSVAPAHLEQQHQGPPLQPQQPAAAGATKLVDALGCDSGRAALTANPGVAGCLPAGHVASLQSSCSGATAGSADPECLLISSAGHSDASTATSTSKHSGDGSSNGSPCACGRGCSLCSSRSTSGGCRADASGTCSSGTETSDTGGNHQPVLTTRRSLQEARPPPVQLLAAAAQGCVSPGSEQHTPTAFEGDAGSVAAQHSCVPPTVHGAVVPADSLNPADWASMQEVAVLREASPDDGPNTLCRNSSGTRRGKAGFLPRLCWSLLPAGLRGKRLGDHRSSSSSARTGGGGGMHGRITSSAEATHTRRHAGQVGSLCVEVAKKPAAAAGVRAGAGDMIPALYAGAAAEPEGGGTCCYATRSWSDLLREAGVSTADMEPAQLQLLQLAGDAWEFASSRGSSSLRSSLDAGSQRSSLDTASQRSSSSLDRGSQHSSLEARRPGSDSSSSGGGGRQSLEQQQQQGAAATRLLSAAARTRFKAWQQQSEQQQQQQATLQSQPQQVQAPAAPAHQPAQQERLGEVMQQHNSAPGDGAASGGEDPVGTPASPTLHQALPLPPGSPPALLQRLQRLAAAFAAARQQVGHGSLTTISECSESMASRLASLASVAVPGSRGPSFDLPAASRLGSVGSCVTGGSRGPSLDAMGVVTKQPSGLGRSSFVADSSPSSSRASSSARLASTPKPATQNLTSSVADAQAAGAGAGGAGAAGGVVAAARGAAAAAPVAVSCAAATAAAPASAPGVGVAGVLDRDASVAVDTRIKKEQEAWVVALQRLKASMRIGHASSCIEAHGWGI